MSYTLKLENGRRVHVSDLSEEEINKTENRYNSMVCHVCHKDEEHSVPKHSLGGFILGAGIGTILANSVLTKQYNKQKAKRTKTSSESSDKKTSTKTTPKAAVASNKKSYLPNGLIKSIDTTSKKRITNKDIVDGVNLNEKIRVPANNKYKKAPKNLSDKKITDQTNYLPKRQIASVNTTYGRNFKREDLRDGAYIKKGVKFAKGGTTEYAKGGNVSSIEKKVNEVNRLIELANKNDISVVDSSSTWESPMKYKPIKYSNGTLYIEYEELDLYKYNRTGVSNWVTKKDKVLKRNMEFDNPLNEIAKMYRKALKSDGIEFAEGGVISENELEQIASDYAYATSSDYDRAVYRLLDSDYTNTLLPKYISAIKEWELKNKTSIRANDKRYSEIYPQFAKGGSTDGQYARGGGIDSDETPRIYVADLAAYNEGKLVGKWLDLTDYSDADDLMAAIQDLMSDFSKEQGVTREEWAIHDFENFPSSFYSEYMGRDEFEKIYQLMEAANDRDIPYEVLGEAMSMKGSDDPYEVADNYNGEYDSFKDFAYQLVDDIGISGVSNPDFYFDYEGFGSDERINMGSEEEEEYGYEDLSDEDLGYELVEQVGGLEGLSERTREMYFDYDKFARDLEMDYDEIRMNGMSYIFFTSYKRGGVPGRYNTGRSWKMDRARHNSKESYEKPTDSRKSYKK